jgi:FdhE protein
VAAKGSGALGPEEIVRRLEMLIGREHVSDDYVRFRIDVLKAQAAVVGVWSRSAAAEAVRPREGEHGPLVNPDRLPLDRALLKKLLDDVLAAAARRGRQGADCTGLFAAAVHDPAILEQLARAAAFRPEGKFLATLSRRTEVSLEALVFFGRLLGAPFVTEAVRRLKRRLPEAPGQSGACPWCGGTPGLAILKRQRGEEGSRILCCTLCGENWPFARLSCPFCGGQEALGVLSVEGTDRCSMETCDTCKRYLKTVDERTLPEEERVVPLVETTATLHLDLIAEREGYSRGLPYAALH